MLTMLLGGLWHGASWNFVIWGGLHGIYLVFHKLYLKGKKPSAQFQYTSPKQFLSFLMNVVITYLLVLITWLFFRATDFETTSIFVTKLLNWTGSEYAGRLFQITGVFYLVVILFDFFEYYTGRHTFLLMIKNKGIVYGILAAMFLVTMVFLFQSDPLPFVYFQF